MQEKGLGRSLESFISVCTIIKSIPHCHVFICIKFKNISSLYVYKTIMSHRMLIIYNSIKAFLYPQAVHDSWPGCPETWCQQGFRMHRTQAFEGVQRRNKQAQTQKGKTFPIPQAIVMTYSHIKQLPEDCREILDMLRLTTLQCRLSWVFASRINSVVYSYEWLHFRSKFWTKYS